MHDPQARTGSPPRATLPTMIHQAIILGLSFYVLAVLALEVISDWPDEVVRLIEQIDFAICLVFLGDWAWFFLKAPDKRHYLKTRFFDLLASIPYASLLRALRVIQFVRVIRALRMVRGLKGVFPILRVLTRNTARSVLLIYLSATLVIYLYCSLGLLHFERGRNDGIRHFGDALWCGFTTLTTVGYGDVYPKTGGGRVMAVFLVLTGLGLFSLVTAEVASTLLHYMKQESERGRD